MESVEWIVVNRQVLGERRAVIRGRMRGRSSDGLLPAPRSPLRTPHSSLRSEAGSC